MLFEVWGNDKRRKMCTDDQSTIPDASTLKILAATGYTFKYKGSAISTTKLINTIYTPTNPAEGSTVPKSKTTDKPVEQPVKQSVTANTSTETKHEQPVAAPKAQPDRSEKLTTESAAKPKKPTPRKLF